MQNNAKVTKRRSNGGIQNYVDNGGNNVSVCCSRLYIDKS